MPGVMSLEAAEYYANPRNQFWDMMSYVTGSDFNVPYQAKKKLLLMHRIALWDVLKSCERFGSLDSNIKEELPNDFSRFFRDYPNLKSVFLNGTKAYQLFVRYSKADVSRLLLPSTSPANASKTFGQKALIWKEKMDAALN